MDITSFNWYIYCIFVDFIREYIGQWKKGLYTICQPHDLTGLNIIFRYIFIYYALLLLLLLLSYEENEEAGINSRMNHMINI